MAGTRSVELDAEARACLEAADRENAPAIDTLTGAEARALRNPRIRETSGEGPALGRVEDRSVPGPGGAIPVRIYAAEAGGSRTGLVYFHGGGFVVGNLDTHDAVCRAIAAESGAVVVAVDYRLAPEHRFPAAVEDAEAATRWVAAQAAELGIDAARICVGGDSAGGNLAAVVARRLRDAGGPALLAQVLIYPVTDVRSFDTRSYRELGESYGLTRSAMQWFAGQYVGEQDAGHPDASPMYAADLGGLPLALVLTAEFDPLRDEGEAYVQRLREAGVAVTLSRYAGMIHGFVAMAAAVSRAHTAIAEVASFIRSVGR